MTDVSENVRDANERASSGFSADTIQYVLNETNVGFWDWHLPSGHVLHSKQWVNMLGYEEGELPPTVDVWNDLLLPVDREAANWAVDRCITGETPVFEAECRMCKKNGEIIWVQDWGVITERNDQGHPTRMVGYMQNVSRLKAAEAAMRRRDEQRDLITRFAGPGSWEWDIANDLVKYSRDYLAMIGYSVNEMSGTCAEWTALVHPDDIAETDRKMNAYLRGDAESYTSEMRLRHRDGHYVWVLETAHIVKRDRDGKPSRVLGAYINTDNLKRAGECMNQPESDGSASQERPRKEAEMSLRDLAQAQRNSQAIFDADPYVSLIFNDQMRVLDCNAAAVQYLGYESKEQLLTGLQDIMTSIIPQRQADGSASISIEQRVAQTARDGYCEFETELLLRGVLTPMRIVMKKINYNDGYAFALYQVDLRQLKEARNELIRQDRLLTAVNQVAEKLMSGAEVTADVTFDELVFDSLRILGNTVGVDRTVAWKADVRDGRPALRSIHQWSAADDRHVPVNDEKILYIDELRRSWDVSTPIEKITESFVLHTPQSGAVPAGDPAAKSMLLAPVWINGELWGGIGFYDHAENRMFTRAEQEILKSGGVLIAAALQREEMVDKLIATRETALASTRAKSDFLSRMSHEIRTPMNAIIGMTAIAKRVRDFAKFQYCIGKIEDASQQLLSIINDVLDMSKIEANRLEIASEPFDFERLIRKVQGVIQVKVDEKHQRFTVDTEGVEFERYVISDELRLSQVLINLLSNAVKFTPEHGDISLKIRTQDGINGAFTLKVSVTDTGIGLTDEQIQRLFTSFEQADGSITRKYGGTGLGLAICKKITNLMGGDIWVKSDFGNGSAFFFEVPAAWGAIRIERDPNRQPPKDLRILVVDDAEDVRIYFKNILDSFSLSSDVAGSGDEAIQMIRAAAQAKRPYGLVFLDWQMPGIDGVETARQIHRETMGGPVVVMMSVADVSDIEHASEGAGVAKYLAKPVLPSVVFNTIVELGDRGIFGGLGGEKEYDFSARQVLLVEDNEINREIIVALLEDTHVKIDCAVNGEEAVNVFRDHGGIYDLVLMDVQMPVLDGIGATRQIRALGSEAAKNCPILAMTANAFKEDIENCLEAGMDGHVAKPVDVDDLLERMERCFEYGRKI